MNFEYGISVMNNDKMYIKITREEFIKFVKENIEKSFESVKVCGTTLTTIKRFGIDTIMNNERLATELIKYLKMNIRNSEVLFSNFKGYAHALLDEKEELVYFMIGENTGTEEKESHTQQNFILYPGCGDYKGLELLLAEKTDELPLYI